MKKIFFFGILFLILFGCVNVERKTKNEPIEQIIEEKVELKCPTICYDSNPCLIGYCDESTNYKCEFEPISGDRKYCEGKLVEKCEEYTCIEGKCTTLELIPCCGNEICEEGENCGNCPKDCKCITELELDICEEFTCIDNECKIATKNLCCGNNICEKGENCGNCPEDCKCEENELCCSKKCIIPICSKNSDCDDKNIFTENTCINLGECNAECKSRNKTYYDFRKTRYQYTDTLCDIKVTIVGYGLYPVYPKYSWSEFEKYYRIDIVAENIGSSSDSLYRSHFTLIDAHTNEEYSSEYLLDNEYFDGGRISPGAQRSGFIIFDTKGRFITDAYVQVGECISYNVFGGKTQRETIRLGKMDFRYTT